MYRLLAIAKYEDRYVIPMSSSKPAPRMEELGISTSSLEVELTPGAGAPQACFDPNMGGPAKPGPVPVDLRRWEGADRK